MIRKLFICTILFCTFPVLSQEIETGKTPAPIASRFSIGSKGGFGHSFLYPYYNCVFDPSWSIGVSALWMTTQHVGLSLDGMYSAEGAKFRSGDLEASMELSYFRVPLMLNFLLRSEEKKLRPKISIGPSLAFLMKENDYQLYNKTDLGLHGALGFAYRLGNNFWFHWDSSYYQGLQDVDNSNSLKDLNANFRMNISLMVGL